MTTSTAAGAARDRWLADLCELHASTFPDGSVAAQAKLAEAAVHRQDALERLAFEEARQTYLADRDNPAVAAAWEAFKTQQFEARQARRQASIDAGIRGRTAVLDFFTEPTWDEYEGMAD